MGSKNGQLQSRWAAREGQKTQEGQSSAEVKQTLGERIGILTFWMKVNKQKGLANKGKCG